MLKALRNISFFNLRTLQQKLVRSYNERYKIVAGLVRLFHVKSIADPLSARLKDEISIRRRSLISRLTAFYLLDWNREDHELSEAIARQFSSKSSRYSLYKTGDRLLRSRIYGKETEDFLRHATLRNFEVNATFRYLDYLAQRYGYHHPEIKRLSRRLSRAKFQKFLTRSQKVRAATALLKLNKSEAADSILRIINEDYLYSGAAPLYLQRSVFEISPETGFYNSRGSKQYKILKESREHFRKLIQQNAKSFCVVGNGPSEIDTGHGPLIDSKNIVIRFNNYDLSRPKDYGSKQGIWVRVPNEESTDTHSFNNDLIILASNGFEYKRENPDRYLLQPYLLGRRFTSVPVKIYVRLIAELGCLPSTGLLMLYWIHTIIGPVPRDAIFGFSHLSQVDDFRSHYFTDTLHRRDHHHAWDREIGIISRIVS